MRFHALSGRRRRRPRANARSRLAFEWLEPRLPLATFMVTTADDSGAGSLRQAITDANNTANTGQPDEIHFAIGSGPQTIAVSSQLPTISEAVRILGNTQPGFDFNPLIELDGTNAPAISHGLSVNSNGSEIRSLVINRFSGSGIHLLNADNNVIAGNYVGTNREGNADEGNGWDGISLEESSFNVIGGTALADMNLISGNTLLGIFVFGGGDNQILNNHIGVDLSGTSPLGNGQSGIALTNSGGNTIGGTTPAARNVISSNGLDGIAMGGSQAIVNEILGNYIGTDVTGELDMGNGGNGIFLTDLANLPNSAASSNTIGGTAAGAGNVISGNGLYGILAANGTNSNFIQGNLIGTTDNGLSPLGNELTGILVHNSSNNIIGGSDLIDGVEDGIVRARNVVSANGLEGIAIEGNESMDNLLIGNYVGLAANGSAGSVPMGNDGSGIVVVNGPVNTLIESDSPVSSNVISGNNGHGIHWLNASSGNITGVIVGTTADGTEAAANMQDGLHIASSSNITIGDSFGLETSRNLFSGNMGAGVRIANSQNVKLFTSYIGTALDGMTGLGNGGAGVVLENSSMNSIGENSTSGNLISANAAGVQLMGVSENNQLVANTIGLAVDKSTELPNLGHGVELVGASQTQIGMAGTGNGNIISANQGDGIHIEALLASENAIVNNIIGSDGDAQQLRGNSGHGISILNADRNRIGGTAAGEANTIVSNQMDGVLIEGADAVLNQVLGNFIGITASDSSMGNMLNGIRINDGASENYIGLLSPANGGTRNGNVISANHKSGIEILVDADGNVVEANRIGTTGDGTGNRANFEYGIWVDQSDGNRIGSPAAGAGNTVAFNGFTLDKQGFGVVISFGTGNAIRGNSIHSNAGRGIDLGNDTVTMNDADDADDGSNNLQNMPIVTSVASAVGVKQITFELDSESDTTYDWEFFANTAPHESGFGDGQVFLGTTQTTTDVFGKSVFNFVTPETNAFISATVTDPDGNTSEFSMIDTDGDALADAWEMTGLDVNEDGTIDLTLAGADFDHKDIYVEVDAMDGITPSALAFADVSLAFEAAPVTNPSGQDGIDLHFEFGGDLAIPRTDWRDFHADGTPKAFEKIKNGDPVGDHTDGTFGTPVERGDPNWQHIRAARRLVYHYAMYVDKVGEDPTDPLTLIKGRGEDGGNDLFIAVGAFGQSPISRDQEAGALMHEFGHNLGLEHGGEDLINNKPNYQSVMNYLWSEPRPGYSDSWRLDYSREQLPTLDEANLDESAGIGGDSSLEVPIGPAYDPFTGVLKPRVVSRGEPIDFNLSGNITGPLAVPPVNVDLNFVGDTDFNGIIDLKDATPGQVLEGAEDWSRLRYHFVSSDRFADSAPLAGSPLPDEFTVGQELVLDSIGNGPGQLAFSHATYQARESDGMAKVYVARAGGTDGAVSVDYAVAVGGTATAGDDFTDVSGTLNFADGQHLQTILIPLDDDSDFEGVETILLELSTPGGSASLGSITTTELQIIEPISVAFSQAQLDLNETNTVVNVELTLEAEIGQMLNEPLVVPIADLGTGSARLDRDYTLPADLSVTFPAGATAGDTQTFALTLLDDVIVDGTRTIHLHLPQLDSLETETRGTVDLLVTIADDDTGTTLVDTLLVGSRFTRDGSLVSRFNLETGEFIDVLAKDPQSNGFWVEGITIDPNTNILYVSVHDQFKIYEYDATTGEFLGEFGQFVSQAPTDLEIGPTGDLFSAALQNDAIKRFALPSEEYLGNFVSPGSGGLDGPYYFNFHGGLIYVSSHFSKEILRYNAFNGAFHSTFVESDDFPEGNSGRPMGLDFRPITAGSLYVAVPGTDQILRFSSLTGGFQQVFAEGVGAGMRDLQWGPDGNLYVVAPEYNLNAEEQRGGAVLRYNATGQLVDILAEHREVYFPSGIAFGKIEQPISKTDFVITETAVSERTRSQTIDIRLDLPNGGILGEAVQVDVVVSPTSTGTPGQDFAPIGVLPVVFPAGSTNGAVSQLTLDLLDDVDLDGHETIELTILASGAQAGLNANTTHRVTIVDDETIPLPGDFSGNGMVDAADYTAWADLLGSADPAADVDQNGVVNHVDLGLWRTNFGAILPTPPGSGSQLDGATVDDFGDRPGSLLSLLAWESQSSELSKAKRAGAASELSTTRNDQAQAHRARMMLDLALANWRVDDADKTSERHQPLAAQQESRPADEIGLPLISANLDEAFASLA